MILELLVLFIIGIANCKFTCTVSHSNNYYRTSSDETELENIGRLIRRYFLGATRFSPSGLVIVTWDRVSHYDEGIDQVLINYCKIKT